MTENVDRIIFWDRIENVLILMGIHFFGVMMKLFLAALILSILFFYPLKNVQAQSINPTPTDYEQQIQKLQGEINALELQNEQVESQVAQGPKPTLNLDGGSLEQDFESNSDSWSILQGQTLNLKFLANPIPGAVGHFDLMFLGKVAPDILHYSYLPTLASENIFVLLKEADVTFTTPDLTFSAFTGVKRASLYYSNDDYFYLLPEEEDIDTPFRVSGRPVNTGMEIKGTNDLDGLDIWAGYELNWGVGQEAVLTYKHDVAGMTLGIIDKVSLQAIGDNAQGVTYAPAVTVTTYTTPPTNEAEAFWKIPVQDAVTIDAVALYSPAGANKTYDYVKNVAPGTGTDGSSYQLYEGTANNTGDAMGYQLQLTSDAIPDINSILINGEYSGILAGDLERISGEITEVPAPYCLFTFDATDQQPLVGANPLVYYGTASNPLGALVEPRSQYDPFQVDLNPITGVNNRQMTKFSLSFVFNNGNGWFFKYNPNDFDSYNINMDLDTNFSTGIIGTLFNYPTSTDLSSYVDAAGDLVWEAPGSLGQPATNGYLPFIHWVTMWKADDIHWVADLQGGYSTAALGQTSAIRSTTDLFQATLTTWVNNTSLALTYGQNVWGPESWDVQFGDTIGQLIIAQLVQKFGLSQISLKYEHWSNLPGDPYQYSSINGVLLPINELYAAYTLNF